MKLKVGTDFSGIGAPEQALKNLGIDFESVFACEIDKHARQSYSAIHDEPKRFIMILQNVTIQRLSNWIYMLPVFLVNHSALPGSEKDLMKQGVHYFLTLQSLSESINRNALF
jgi:DNA (cytosine-5)-methyltransferase 1